MFLALAKHLNLEKKILPFLVKISPTYKNTWLLQLS